MQDHGAGASSELCIVRLLERWSLEHVSNAAGSGTAGETKTGREEERMGRS